MAARFMPRAALALVASLAPGCSSPFEDRPNIRDSLARAIPAETEAAPPSAHRPDAETPAPSLGASPGPEAFVRYALYHSPDAEAAYQRWVAAAERVPQARALPDPRLTLGLFIEEVETRVGPQEARFGISQGLPWPGVLDLREDAATRAARAAWRRLESVRLDVARRTLIALYELAHLDRAVAITEENLDLLASFEEVIRARYRVGSGQHPELIRVQLELGELRDRLARLIATRPVYVAELNAALNRPAGADVPRLGTAPARVVDVDAETLVTLAGESNPDLLALEEEVERRREQTELARLEGRTGFTLGLDYILTGDAVNPGTPGSGEDPVLLTLGVDVPLWRGKYDALVRESVALRLAAARDLESEANRLAASIHRAWFDHTDAHRRVLLYEQSLIPKAEESLRAILGAYRAGTSSFLDLLEAERTLLEFALAGERARTDRAVALAELAALVGEPIPTVAAEEEVSQ